MGGCLSDEKFALCLKCALIWFDIPKKYTEGVPCNYVNNQSCVGRKFSLSKISDHLLTHESSHYQSNFFR